MMQFRTPVAPLRHQGIVDHRTPVVTLGSCFADAVARRLSDRLFAVTANPFGTLYNPASIAAAARRISGGTEFTPDELFCHERRWRSWLCHTLLSFEGTAEEAATQFNRHLAKASEALRQSRVAIVTLGTAWVFALRSTGETVANCHKLSSELFERRMLNVDESARLITEACESMRSASPGLTVILSVSPIRHAADGHHGNQLSKSTLMLAAEEAIARLDRPDAPAIYFPAFEAVIDDLRDYRFYDTDMRHPTSQAADYVFGLFAESFFTSDTASLSERCLRLTRRLAHRPLTGQPDTAFTAATAAMARELAESHPYLRNVIPNI